MNEETSKVFLLQSMQSFSPCKISRHLARPKLYLLGRVLGSTKCDVKHCEVCMNVSQLRKFTSTVTGETSNITAETHKIIIDLTVITSV